MPDTSLVTSTAVGSRDGRKYVIAAVAIGEKQLEGKLEGTALHWACSGGNGKSWQPPPHGWHTIPPESKPAGNHQNRVRGIGRPYPMPCP